MKKHTSFVFILCISLVPRLISLNTFLTPDEFLWLERSRDFLLALQKHNWAATFQTGHPGITTMWAGSLGMLGYGLRHNLFRDNEFNTFLHALTWDHLPFELITWVRVPIALVTALSVVGIACLLKRLFNREIAVIAGILLALDPWYLGHSRLLHHDALMTSFMTLSLLMLLVYLRKNEPQWLLIVSGACAGLAVLSKVLSLFLGLWVGLLFSITVLMKKRSLVAAIVEMATWSLSAGIIGFALWPAMWLEPFNVIERIVQMTTTYAINPHEAGQFFMGKTVADPGWLFYPVVMLFALTPLVLIGILMTTQRSVCHKQERRAGEFSQRMIMFVLLVYCVLYMVFISFGEKKQDRYLLPTLVLLNVIASPGIYELYSRVSRRWSSNKWLWYLTGICVLAGQGATSLTQHPYYFTYYNPLLGGVQGAARYLAVGWGEGNELAARYLNRQLPGTDTITTVATMSTAFAPYFSGQTIPWSWDPYGAFAANYVVIYRREVQEGQLDPHVLDYIQESWPLEKTIELHGLPYAWIYHAPEADWSVSEDYKSEAILSAGLLAYRVNSLELRSGQRLNVMLYRRCRAIDEEKWTVIARNANDQQITLETQSNSQCELDTIVEEAYHVTIHPDMAAGRYDILIGFQSTGQPVSWLDLAELPQIRIVH